MTISEATFNQAKLAYERVDPYVPSIAKKAALTGVAYTPVLQINKDIAKRAATSLGTTACSAADYTEKLVLDTATTIGDAAIRTKVLFVNQDAVITTAVNAKNVIVDTTSSAANRVKTTTTSATNRVISTTSNAASFVGQTAINAKDKVLGTAIYAKDMAVETATGAVNYVRGNGKSTINDVKENTEGVSEDKGKVASISVNSEY